MVSTRSSSAALMTPRGGRSSSPTPPTPSALLKTRTPRATATPAWSHVPSTFTLTWLAISLPLVFWDMAYVFLRPHSMPGGSLHWPLWVPYAIQAELDYTYGWKEWNAGGGWNTAQTTMNLLESFAYLTYLAIWYTNAKRLGPNAAKVGLTGRTAAVAVLIGFSTFLSTFTKTVLYWLNEAFSGFANIGHNPPVHLFIFWIIPNGAWIVFPAILAYQFGNEIVTGLTKASSTTTRSAKSE